MLNFADVRILPQKDTGCIELTTSDRSYSLTRKCLKTLKDEAGLPVSLHSEEVAAALSGIPNHQKGRGTLVFVAGSGDLPDRYENRFILPVWKMNVRGPQALNALSEEIAAQLRGLGLTCVVKPIHAENDRLTRKPDRCGSPE